MAPRVLVVEDEYLVRDMIVHELQLAGFEVLEAESAEKGLALLKPATGSTCCSPTSDCPAWTAGGSRMKFARATWTFP